MTLPPWAFIAGYVDVPGKVPSGGAGHNVEIKAGDILSSRCRCDIFVAMDLSDYKFDADLSRACTIPAAGISIPIFSRPSTATSSAGPGNVWAVRIRRRSRQLLACEITGEPVLIVRRGRMGH